MLLDENCSPSLRSKILQNWLMQLPSSKITEKAIIMNWKALTLFDLKVKVYVVCY